MISKGASQAAAIAKDVSLQATQKASEFSSQNSGLLSGVASKATEIGQKSWGGLSQFVKSPSLQGLGNILPKTGYEDMASPNEQSSSTSFNARSNCDTIGGFNSFDKPSGQAGDAFFSLAGLAVFVVPESGVEKKKSAADTKKKTAKTAGSSATVSPSQADAEPSEGLAVFVVPESGVEKKKSAADTKKKTAKTAGSSATVSPSQADAEPSEDSTITQFEASFNKPRRPPAATTSASSTTKKAESQSSNKGWDDDAWAILNN
ncbi:unnamed protein product [Nippostrongylus brasiliensis]|uniref:Zgc: n=1 Tax=Nippostrongylus brasiliensis TaxID=27835 RepID=A0A0N4YYQ2_NIPBR|nr:unnamed protein product [Nippostrongylus brasiliensis]